MHIDHVHSAIALHESLHDPLQVRASLEWVVQHYGRATPVVLSEWHSVHLLHHLPATSFPVGDVAHPMIPSVSMTSVAALDDGTAAAHGIVVVQLQCTSWWNLTWACRASLCAACSGRLSGCQPGGGLPTGHDAASCGQWRCQHTRQHRQPSSPFAPLCRSGSLAPVAVPVNAWICHV